MKRLIFASIFLVATLEARPVCLHSRKECELVSRWYESGTAAGNRGDYYDNRDRDHSRLNLKKFPQFNEVSYSEQERARHMDWGGQVRLLPHITIGNSSTSAGVPKGGSNVRQMYYTTQKGMDFLYQQYRRGNLYVYPEHRDHDPGHNGSPGYGDLFPLNSPYVLLSQGSSGSDKPFLEAIAHTLAAFRPEVKTWLQSAHLLMPTVQQILRSTQKGADYFSGEAHPTVFDAKRLDPVAMVKAAHEVTLTKIPPVVSLKVLEEQSSIGSLIPAANEKLCTTPSVIARIHRRSQESMRMVVSAKKSHHMARTPLKYKWVVLRGDPDRIKIKEKERGVAEITVKYHERRPIAPGSRMESNRVDIGVFAGNDHAWSAPAFVTFYTLDNELRTYVDGELKEIFFEASDPNFSITDWSKAMAMAVDEELFIGHEVAVIDERRRLWRDRYEAQLRAEADRDEALRLKRENPSDKKLGGAHWRKKVAADRAKEETMEVVLERLPELGGDSVEARIRAHVASRRADESTYLAYRDEPQFHSMVREYELLEDEPMYGYKRYLLERLNLAVLVKEIYPGFLKAEDRFNYVDTRLTTPKDKRMVF